MTNKAAGKNKGNGLAVYFSDRINRMDWINFIL
jgi:hypothetical protein